MMKRIILLLAVLTGSAELHAQNGTVSKQRDEIYWNVVSKRAEKIVSTLGIADSTRWERVRNLIARQYYELNGIHDRCKAEQGKLKGKGGSREQIEAELKILQANADNELIGLHRNFLEALSGELSPEQTEGVKNGMTYGVLPITYAGYLDMIPELKEEEKQQILIWLTEAREHAMDAGSSEEKHGWFGKYKGRINNYLSSRGYDLKKYSEAREARIREAQASHKPLQVTQNGELIYRVDSLGSRIPDFSYAGYCAAEEEIPFVPVKVRVPVRDGDATAAIQTAIDQVASLPAGTDGFKGAVLLEKGVHQVSGSLLLRSPGVVLRGCGSGEDGTVLEGSGKSRETLVRILGENDCRETQVAEITDPYVPVNALSFEVDNTSGLKPGDLVVVLRPSTKEWISFTGMEDFGGETGWLGWKAGDQDIRWIRTVVSVSGNKITLDAPLTTALDKKYGGGKLIRAEWPGRLQKTGIENMLLRSEYDPGNPKDEEHRWMAITIENTDDAWVRQVNFEHFAGSAVAVYETGRRITIEDCRSLQPISEVGGQRRNTFFVSGGQVLVQRCYAEYGYHDFAVGALAPGPNAFVQCESHLPDNYSGTTGNWASGVLFDVVNVDGHALGFPNRGPEGYGAGWTGANCMLWQCSAARLDNPAPPGAMNWAYGAWALFNGNGYWEDPNNHVRPRSLYYAQLEARIKGSSEKAHLLLTETNGTSSPTVAEAAGLNRLAAQAAPTLSDWIGQAVRRNPIDISGEGAPSIDDIGIPRSYQPTQAQAMKIENGWLVRGSRVLTGMRLSVPWWSGNIRARGLAGAPPALTRFVPGRTGAGYTDDLDRLTDTMRESNQSGVEQNYALWYDRRRDDHERVRRMDGDVWPPFYEVPFARSGQGLAWDGLSKYDLTKYNPWYWSRLKEFAGLADQKGLILLHQNYFQHNILEAGAHWADFAWRSANNINRTGFPEPPPYAGDKRIFMDEQFYDVSHPVRRELHRAYIRQCLENFRGNSGVIQLTGEEYTGPLHFVQFWLDVIAEWEKETGVNVLAGLSVTKDVQDAILADPQRSETVDVIDIRRWAYRDDGSLYAPEGGQHLAPRQHARLVQPGKRSFGQVCRAVSEYRKAWPEKAVIYSEGQYTGFAWAVFMGGGSLAPIPPVEQPGFTEKASSMQPAGNPAKGVYMLKNRSGESIIWLSGDSPEEADLSLGKGSFVLHRIDPATGKTIGKAQKLSEGKLIRLKVSGEKPEIIFISR
ncbi:MAG: DUF6298 domain-containing protein [Mangrovibacterium sp.]